MRLLFMMFDWKERRENLAFLSVFVNKSVVKNLSSIVVKIYTEIYTENLSRIKKGTGRTVPFKD